MDTEQLNFRISKDLLKDIEEIARVLKVSKTEWIKVKLAELVAKEQFSVYRNVEDEYFMGRINNKQYADKLGFKPPQDVIKARKRLKKIGKDTLRIINQQIYKKNQQ